MNNKHYRVEILPTERGIFKMNSPMAKPIIDCIKNLKIFAGFSFGEVPGYELRIMKLCDTMGHSYKKVIYNIILVVEDIV